MKSILLILSNMLTVLLSIVASFGIVWFTLPNIGTTEFGLFVLEIFSTTSIFWMTIISSVTLVLLFVLNSIFGRNSKSKLKNFFIHLITWLICAICVVFAIYTFFYCNPLVSEKVIITLPRKISIGIIVLVLVLFHVFSSKISTIINRKIQAYDTAKEMNTVGRSSVIWINFLKLFEVFFPEMLILLLICYCVSWNVASYFIVVLIASLLPMLGNIACDFNTRAEIRRNEERAKAALAKQVADNIKRG